MYRFHNAMNSMAEPPPLEGDIVDDVQIPKEVRHCIMTARPACACGSQKYVGWQHTSITVNNLFSYKYSVGKPCNHHNHFYWSAMTTVVDSDPVVESLQSSLLSASSPILPRTDYGPQQNGLLLLDTKTELMLSYVQNMIFLIVVNLRNYASDVDKLQADQSMNEITKKLVELRVYLEKGVRPLEGKLKYQLEKLFALAAEADVKVQNADKVTRQSRGGTASSMGDDLGSENEPSDTEPTSNIVSDLSYRPNLAAFKHRSDSGQDTRDQGDGIYRPPRIAPTAPPTFDQKHRQRKPRKSALVDEYIREDMTDAPIAEPSIGTGSGLRGKDRERAQERQDFEEQRLVRLPGEKKSRRRGGGDGELDLGFGSLADVDLGDLKSKGGKKKLQGDGLGPEVGEKWEKRMKKGLKRKRR